MKIADDAAIQNVRAFSWQVDRNLGNQTKTVLARHVKQHLDVRMFGEPTC